MYNWYVLYIWFVGGSLVLDLTDASLLTRSAIWVCVPEVLFPRHERSEISLKVFGKNYYPYLIYKVLLTFPCQRNGKHDSVYVRFYNFTLIFLLAITCIFRMGDLILSSILAAYLSVSRAYTDHIINNTGGLAIEQLEAKIIKKGTICLYREVINRLTEQVHYFLSPNIHLQSICNGNKTIKRISCFKVVYYLNKVYSLAVMDFPQTYRSILTLRHCMLNSDEYGRDRLVERLISDVDSKLLNVVIIIVRSSFQLFKFRKRPDTVRQIITYITSEKRDDLAAHLAKKRGTIVDEDELTGANDDFLPEAMDTSNWRKWKLIIFRSESGRFRQAADVFNMLVSVYGSKEMFVKEYRQLLAERLTSSNTKDVCFYIHQFVRKYVFLSRLALFRLTFESYESYVGCEPWERYNNSNNNIKE
uniref:Annexin n=1 Tax=Heterorhabditis bacteriophora TaxID=37862 RepID=A0A1I7WCL2_HETBA